MTDTQSQLLQIVASCPEGNKQNIGIEPQRAPGRMKMITAEGEGKQRRAGWEGLE